MKRFATFCFALLFAASAGFTAETDKTCVKCFLESCRDLEPLFNGKDMTGWRVVSGIEWAVEDGALVGPIKTPGWIATEEEYDNFVLSLEYWVAKNDTHESNSGIFLRSGLDGDPWINGYESQISLQDEKNPTGSIYNRCSTKLERMQRIAPEKQWNRVKIYAYGPHIVSRINDEAVQDCFLHVRDKGVIGLQMHHPGVTIKFRNIALKRLTEMPECEKGWRSIFNGKDLTGWTVRGKAKWEVKDGVLVGTGGMGHIYYTAETFKDFEMRAMIRINKDGNSGFYFRCRPPENNIDGWPVGYECQVDNHDPNNYTGAVYGKQNVKELITRDETWFSERVRVQGDHIQTWVNGMLETDFTDREFKDGYIALQGHDPSIVVEYRDIMVRPLD
ncbi:MAG TPA: DUF1080 domain-containing protein [bacterium]|nr:DUF1080 domain-containing protein [bacterium]HQL61137.1 DUF1080 domain-containing protein [bacterium]